MASEEFKVVNKKELIGKINSLDALTTEEKSALIDLLKQKKYGLVWENKPEDVEERLRAELPVLREVKDKALLDGGEDAPNHILIEGDNLEALTALAYTHENSVDVIYIDPPYNTGNKDFVYNDKIIGLDDQYRHSQWLSFMEKRLRIAKRIMSEKATLFMSIDENEAAHLKILSDEIFSENNFMGNIIWQSRTSISNDDFISTNHNQTLIYAKNISKVIFDGEMISSKDYINPDNDPRGPWKLVPIDANHPGGDTVYGITNPKTGVEYFPPKNRIWAYSRAGMQELINDGRIKFGVNDDSSPKKKLYYLERIERGDTKTPSSILLDAKTTKDGTNELIDILGKKKFDYPKPKEFIRRLLMYASQRRKNATILDFFAGSGTTLHATMQLNAEDGGHRKCILVTNNENNICEEVTYERNKRVINGYTTPKGEEVEGLKSNNLRYYQIDHVERESSLTAKRKLMAASAELLCIKHDIYEESITFGTLKLKPHIARYFANDKQQMLVIYMVEAIERIVEEIQTMPEDTNIMVYVFSTNNYAMDADFEDVADKVTLCALPAAIYNAYLKVLPKKGEPKQIIEEDAE